MLEGTVLLVAGVTKVYLGGLLCPDTDDSYWKSKLSITLKSTLVMLS